MNRILTIVVIVGLLGFAGYKIFSGRVDRTNQPAVATAFLKALKGQDLSRAKKYWVPDQADAWQESAKAALGQMRSNASAAFNDAIPDEPTFVDVPSPKGSTDKTIQAGGTTLSMRQVDGNWCVSKSSQP